MQTCYTLLESIKSCLFNSIKQFTTQKLFEGNSWVQNKTFVHKLGLTEHSPSVSVPPFSSFRPPPLFTGIQSDLDRQLVEEQWEMLRQMMGEKGAFVFGNQGCLTDTELHSTLKVRE